MCGNAQRKAYGYTMVGVAVTMTLAMMGYSMPLSATFIHVHGLPWELDEACVASEVQAHLPGGVHAPDVDGRAKNADANGSAEHAGDWSPSSPRAAPRSRFGPRSGVSQVSAIISRNEGIWLLARRG